MSSQDDLLVGSYYDDDFNFDTYVSKKRCTEFFQQYEQPPIEEPSNVITTKLETNSMDFKDLKNKLLDPDFLQLSLPTTKIDSQNFDGDSSDQYDIAPESHNPDHITQFIQSIDEITFEFEDDKNIIIRRITMLISSDDIKFDFEWHAGEEDLQKFIVFALVHKQPLNYKLIASSLQYIRADSHIFVDSIAHNVINRNIKPENVFDLLLLVSLVLVKNSAVALLISNYLRENNVYAKYYGKLKTQYPFVYHCLQKNITDARSLLIGIDMKKYLQIK